MKTQKISLSELRNVIKNMLKEEVEQEYYDLFEYHEKQPNELKVIVDKYSQKLSDGLTQDELNDFLKEVETIGYTFDYYLDLEPYGLRPIGVELTQLKGWENINESKDSINKKYTHFAIRKSDNKIVNGWEYDKDLDKESILEYCKLDLKDDFPGEKLSNFKILTKASIEKQGINPFDSTNWFKINENMVQENDYGYSEDEYLESPEYFVETFHNGQFGQLKKMLVKFKVNNKMSDLLSHLNEIEAWDIKDWIIVNS